MPSLATQTTAESASTEIVFIDGAIADADLLSSYMRPGVEVVLLDPNQDGILQISQALSGRVGVENVQIFSHGAADSLYLGNTELNLDTIDALSGQISQWSSALSDTADLLLFGCDVAAAGTTLMQRLSDLTGADVAASNNLTGRQGDWNLEVATGSIEAMMAARTDALANYSGNLNVITVTSAANTGAGSLRDAIARAASGSVIRFASGLANRTITLSSQLVITPGKNLVIDGSAAPNLSISGNRATRIFYVNSNQDFPTRLTLRSLKLVDGFTAENGGAIRGEHRASVLVENVSFLRNVANQGGGAIYSPWENNLTVRRSVFQGNRATAGNNERGAGAIAFLSPGALTIENSNFVGNVGINGGAVNSLNGKLTITNSRFLNNNTLAARFASGQPRDFLRGFGGALYVDRASATSEASGFVRINGTRFEGNKGQAEGGAAYIYTGGQDRVDIGTTVFRNNSVQALSGGGNQGNGGGLVLLSNEVNRGFTLNRTSFVGNVATNQGGGLWMLNAPTTITNSTFSGNRAVGNDFNRLGGAMLLQGTTTIVNSTIANNSAGWVGGGVMAGSNYSVTARNTIFYRNTANNGGNTWNIQQHTNRALSNGGGNIQTGRANDDTAVQNIRFVDARLGALGANGHPFLLSHALLAGSPAINTGVATGAPAIDQTGTRRDSLVDVGAEEFGSGAASTASTALTQPTINTVAGGAGRDRLVGTAGVDQILGRGGNDLLIGRKGGDSLVGGTGADHFIYQGNGIRAALGDSLVSAPDRIQGLVIAEGDRLRLDFDNNLATRELPLGFFNAGTVAGATRSAATSAAFADKNQATAGAQALGGREAVLFTWQQRTFIAVNDQTQSFNASSDLVVDVTGIQKPATHGTAGVLPTTSYFA